MAARDELFCSMKSGLQQVCGRLRIVWSLMPFFPIIKVIYLNYKYPPMSSFPAMVGWFRENNINHS